MAESTKENLFAYGMVIYSAIGAAMLQTPGQEHIGWGMFILVGAGLLVFMMRLEGWRAIPSFIYVIIQVAMTMLIFCFVIVSLILIFNIDWRTGKLLPGKPVTDEYEIDGRGIKYAP